MLFSLFGGGDNGNLIGMALLISVRLRGKISMSNVLNVLTLHYQGGNIFVRGNSSPTCLGPHRINW